MSTGVWASGGSHPLQTAWQEAAPTASRGPPSYAPAPRGSATRRPRRRRRSSSSSGPSLSLETPSLTRSKAGDFLDHALDRYADLFIIGGLAGSGFGGFAWGFYAVTGVFLTSYMGTQAAAVGLKRDYKGVLGRADRLILLTFVPLLAAVLVLGGLPSTFLLPGGLDAYGLPPSVTLIQGLLGTFAVLGHATAVQRFRRARAALVAG